MRTPILFSSLFALIGFGCSQAPEQQQPGTDASTETHDETDASGATPFASVSDFAAPGPFEVVTGETDPECTIVHPANLGKEGHKHPIILWGNGTYMTPIVYDGILRHWASHGFVVAAANTSWAGTGTEMLHCLEYLMSAHEQQTSSYFNRLDIQSVGASGHSQGGGGTLMVGTDVRIKATAPLQPYTEQGWGGYDQTAQTQQQGPMFMMSGTDDIIAPSQPNQQRVWDTTNAELFWGMLDGANHLQDAMGNISRYRGPSTAWMRTHLMNDQNARLVFYDDCTLCDDPDWDIQYKAVNP